jgi:DTW domain-containing protein YfiP
VSQHPGFPSVATPGGERDLCRGCLRARAVCYCDQLEKFAPRTRFVILQHPRERRRTVGSARMAHLCIEGSRLIWGATFGGNPEVNEILHSPRNHCTILFPGPTSRVLSREEPARTQAAFPDDRERVVFVIDGTWDCARTMLSKSPNLRELPRICFTPRQKSIYGFRRQPRPECLSTLEAIHELVQILDPEVCSDILMRLFRGMVEHQLGYHKPGQKRRGRV